MNIIAIVDRSWGIAKHGKQIITIPEDLRHFQELTMGGTVIMGRKTYEAIGHALPGRWNVCLSRDQKFECDNAIHLFSDLEEVIDTVCNMSDVFVIGGESIYRQLLPYCDMAYITYVDADLGADQFIPDLDSRIEWRLVREKQNKTINNINYYFCEYERV